MEDDGMNGFLRVRFFFLFGVPTTQSSGFDIAWWFDDGHGVGLADVFFSSFDWFFLRFQCTVGACVCTLDAQGGFIDSGSLVATNVGKTSQSNL